MATPAAPAPPSPPPPRRTAARALSSWPKRRKLAHAFLRECSWKMLKSARPLGQPGVFLTCGCGGGRDPACGGGCGLGGGCCFCLGSDFGGFGLCGGCFGSCRCGCGSGVGGVGVGGRCVGGGGGRCGAARTASASPNVLSWSAKPSNASGPPPSPGRCSHSDTTLYSSLAILHTEHTGRRQNGSTVCAHPRHRSPTWPAARSPAPAPPPRPARGQRRGRA